MAHPIETWRIKQFGTMAQHLLQQQGGKLRSAVSSKSGYSGKSANPVNQLGSTEARELTARNMDSPNIEVPLERPWVKPTSYDWGTLVDKVDRVKLGIQPDGEFTQAGLQALRRFEDQQILKTFFGTALRGEEGGTSVTFPASANDVAHGSAGLTLAKLIEAREILAGNHVDLESEEIHMVITEKEEADILNIATLTSDDYMTVKPLASGRLPEVLGIKFVMFARSTLKKAGLYDGSNTTQLPCWVKSRMHLGIWDELKTEIAQDPGKNFNTRIYMCASSGATRLEEGGVVRVNTYHT